MNATVIPFNIHTERRAQGVAFLVARQAQRFGLTAPQRTRLLAKARTLIRNNNSAAGVLSLTRRIASAESRGPSAA